MAMPGARGWVWRRGRKGPGRPHAPRFIEWFPGGTVSFIPVVDGLPRGGPPVVLEPDELEAYRLVYYLGLSQEEAAERMGVSRGTLWRLLSSARRKIAEALVETRPLVLMPPHGGVNG